MSKVAEVENALDGLEKVKRRVRFQYQYQLSREELWFGVRWRNNQLGWVWFDMNTMKTKIHQYSFDVIIGVPFFIFNLNWRFDKIERV